MIHPPFLTSNATQKNTGVGGGGGERKARSHLVQYKGSSIPLGGAPPEGWWCKHDLRSKTLQTGVFA